MRYEIRDTINATMEMHMFVMTIFMSNLQLTASTPSLSPSAPSPSPSAPSPSPSAPLHLYSLIAYVTMSLSCNRDIGCYSNTNRLDHPRRRPSGWSDKNSDIM